MQSGDTTAITALRRRCDRAKDTVSDAYHSVQEHLRTAHSTELTVLYVYVNLLQETREILSSLRKYLRAYAKIRDSRFRSRETV